MTLTELVDNYETYAWMAQCAFWTCCVVIIWCAFLTFRKRQIPPPPIAPILWRNESTHLKEEISNLRSDLVALEQKIAVVANTTHQWHNSAPIYLSNAQPPQFDRIP